MAIFPFGKRFIPKARLRRRVKFLAVDRLDRRIENETAAKIISCELWSELAALKWMLQIDSFVATEDRELHLDSGLMPAICVSSRTSFFSPLRSGLQSPRSIAADSKSSENPQGIFFF